MTPKRFLSFALLVVATGHVVGCGTGPNKDAMTMAQCRERLAMPKDRRPPPSDPSIDKDAICENMLGAETAPKRAASEPAASASPRR